MNIRAYLDLDRLRRWRRPPAPEQAVKWAPRPVDPARLNRRLIFTVTTGRSGTEYLTHVLGLFRDVHAEHEPEPSFTTAFRVIAAAPELASSFWLEHKLPRIAAVDAPIYAETSHVVCKGFLESAVDLGLRPMLVHLVRPYRAIARSLLALNTIPSRTYNGVRYYLGPTDRVLLPVPREVFERWHDYQLCYWYCLEIGERARVYAERYGSLGVRVERVELDAIGSVEGIRELGRRLDLGPLSPAGTRELTQLAGRRTNTKSDAKRELAFSDQQFELWEREVETTVLPRAVAS